jgi:hypothetical protein
LITIAKADDEVVEAEVAVDLHDVPDDRLAADFDHGLGPHHGFLGNPGSETTGQNDDLLAIAATVKAPSGANQRMATPNTSTARIGDRIEDDGRSILAPRNRSSISTPVPIYEVRASCGVALSAKMRAIVRSAASGRAYGTNRLQRAWSPGHSPTRKCNYFRMLMRQAGAEPFKMSWLSMSQGLQNR